MYVKMSSAKMAAILPGSDELNCYAVCNITSQLTKL